MIDQHNQAALAIPPSISHCLRHLPLELTELSLSHSVEILAVALATSNIQERFESMYPERRERLESNPMQGAYIAPQNTIVTHPGHDRFPRTF